MILLSTVSQNILAHIARELDLSVLIGVTDMETMKFHTIEQ
jgi:hypothetical protein